MQPHPQMVFVVGAGISAHQTEGNNSTSDWWAFERDSLAAQGKEASGDAVDHWNRYAQDVSLLADAGMNALRFSLEWARVEPKEGTYDTQAIEHYRHELRRLRQRGLFACVTLWHFTLPAWAADRGGMEHPAVRSAFLQYVRRMCREYEGLVDMWITMNEPMVFAMEGYRWGTWPPGKQSRVRTWRMFATLAYLHRRTSRVLKQCTHAPVGIAKSFITYHAMCRSDLPNRIVAWIKNVLWNDVFFWLTHGTNDFIGVNYYIGQIIGPPKGKKPETDDMGWITWPEGLYLALLRAARHGLPVYVTENGIATEDDEKRIAYIQKSLFQVKRARRTADIRGYFYWSLLDNFEWDKGYKKRFGLIAVDRATMQREPKPSLAALGRLAKNMR